MSLLFSPLILNGLTLKNRIVMSPMCQYSAIDGVVQDWHFEHLGERAKGGVGTIIVEATGVLPNGRITPQCLGLWNDEQERELAKLVAHLKTYDVACGIQLAHAGRKASAKVPWNGGGYLPIEQGGWPTVAPSAVAFSERYGTPREMSVTDIKEYVLAFKQAAERAIRAGFDIVELHMAHGYLMHEFLSPLSNFRKDNYGGAFENRTRFPLEVVDAVRSVLNGRSLWVRISATDWVEDGWTIDDSIAFAKVLKSKGVSMIDCSTGGNIPSAPVPVGPAYQVFAAEKVRAGADIPSGAVGLITQAQQAEGILEKGSADLIFLGRELLRNPYWAQLASKELDNINRFPVQYERAF